MNILDNMLESNQYVIKNAKDVKINYERLNNFIENIDCSNLKNWLGNNPYNLFNLGIEKIVNFLLLFEAIDYCFWGEPKWKIETVEGIKDGSDALLYVLLNYVRKNDCFVFDKISLNDFKKILNGNVEIPFIEERYNTLKQISEIVNKNLNGNFYEAIKKLTIDKDLFDYIVQLFPSFKDERIYKGKTIYYYKLAQLLVSDILHLRNQLEGINVDYSNLLGCPDYKIPQTLRALGIIEYSSELANIIDNKKEIKISSSYEIEIRSSVIVVINYIKSKLKDSNAIDINDYLFGYSKKVKELTKPYHLCRNKNY